MRAICFLLFGGLVTLSGCESKAPAPSAGTNAGVVQPAETAPAETDWTQVAPGGETRCTDGSEFHFLVRQGDRESLVFYLEGGGGCWNKASCDPAGTPTAKINLAGQEAPDEGIFDFANPKNPFSRHTVVYVPYCSGDVHIGLNDVVYPGTDESDPPLPVAHRGRANVQSAMDWVTSNHETLNDIFVSGSSAGAVPAPLYASMLAGQYGDARITSLGDGAGGYRRATPMTNRLSDWGVFNHINNIAGFEDLSPPDWTYEQLYIYAARAYPEVQHARFDFASDPAQWRFLSGNSTYDTLLQNLLANNEDIRRADPGFRAYIAAGAEHTILQKNALYELTTEDTPLIDWVSAIASHKAVDDVTCSEC